MEGKNRSKDDFLRRHGLEGIVSKTGVEFGKNAQTIMKVKVDPKGKIKPFVYEAIERAEK
jgi:hypothetical protein